MNGNVTQMSKEDAVVNASTINIIPEISAEMRAAARLDEVSPISSLGSEKMPHREAKVALTFQVADRHRNLPPTAFDRKFDKIWALKLARHMLQDTFLPEIVQLADCEFNGIIYRINGNHLSHARCIVEEENPEFSKNFSPTVRFLHYKAETEEDMRLLYANYDRAKVRDPGTVYNAYLFKSAGFEDCSKKTIKSLAEGLRGYLWIFDASKRDADEICYQLKTQYAKLGGRVSGLFETILIHSRYSKHLRRSSVYAAMFATCEKNLKEATEFWQHISDGVGLSADDPCLKLRNLLLAYSVKQILPRATGSVVSAELMYRWCIDAWNAHRSGTSFKANKVVKGERSVAV
jgi:hypothetical protein